jgi:hypothetical protein
MSFSKLSDTDKTSNAAAMLAQQRQERQDAQDATMAETEATRKRLEAQHSKLFREGFGSNYPSRASLGSLSMGSTFSRQQSQQQQQQQQQYPSAFAPPPASGTRMRASYNMMGHEELKPDFSDLLPLGGKSHRRRAKKAKRSRKARRSSRRSRRTRMFTR